MKKLCQFTLCLAAAVALAAAPAMAFAEESGLVVLCVSAENAELYAEPDAGSESVAEPSPGTVLLAEAWPIRASGGEGAAWYRVVGLADAKTGGVTGALQAFRNAWAYPYVRADLVRPYSGKLSTAAILEGAKATPYGLGYSAVDSSATAQRRLAEHNILTWVVPPANGVLLPIHSRPDQAAELLGQYSEDNWLLVVVDDSRPGWLQVVDLAAAAPSGWVEANLVELSPRDERFPGFEPGYLVTLGLGANVAEIMRRWGPGAVEARQVEKTSTVYDEGTEYETEDSSIEVSTRISAAGFELTYSNCTNFTFTLTRPRAGMGGIFVGAEWCDKAYIERVFKALSPQFSTHEGLWRCSLGGGPDSWSFVIHLEFDNRGLVSKFFYQCRDVPLN